MAHIMPSAVLTFQRVVHAKPDVELQSVEMRRKIKHVLDYLHDRHPRWHGTEITRREASAVEKIIYKAEQELPT